MVWERRIRGIKKIFMHTSGGNELRSWDFFTLFLFVRERVTGDLRENFFVSLIDAKLSDFGHLGAVRWVGVAAIPKIWVLIFFLCKLFKILTIGLNETNIILFGLGLTVDSVNFSEIGGRIALEYFFHLRKTPLQRVNFGVESMTRRCATRKLSMEESFVM